MNKRKTSKRNTVGTGLDKCAPIPVDAVIPAELENGGSPLARFKPSVEIAGEFAIETTPYLQDWRRFVEGSVLTIKLKETYLSRGDSTVQSTCSAARSAAKEGYSVRIVYTIVDPDDHYAFFNRCLLEKFNGFQLSDLDPAEAGSNPKLMAPYQVPWGPGFYGPLEEELFEHFDVLTGNQGAFISELREAMKEMNDLDGVTWQTYFAKQTSPMLRVGNGPILEGQYPLRMGSGIAPSLFLYPGSSRFDADLRDLAEPEHRLGSCRKMEDFTEERQEQWLKDRKAFLKLWFASDDQSQYARTKIERISKKLSEETLTFFDVWQEEEPWSDVRSDYWGLVASQFSNGMPGQTE